MSRSKKKPPTLAPPSLFDEPSPAPAEVKKKPKRPLTRAGAKRPTPSSPIDLFDPEPVKPSKKTSRWMPAKSFRVYPEGESAAPEHVRIRRRHPFPQMLDETLSRLLPLIPRPPGPVLILGACLPGVAACAPRGDEHLEYLAKDAHAAEAIKKLIPDATVLKNESEVQKNVKFSLVVDCNESDTGPAAAARIVSLFNLVSKSGRVVFASPCEALLDYKGETRNDAPQMRDQLHRLCKTHCILRPTDPLMHPAWDIIVLSRRLEGSFPGRCRWRVTGTGFLPWQKCNEAISTSPWLLVELSEQLAPAIARVITYPWEPFS